MTVDFCSGSRVGHALPHRDGLLRDAGLRLCQPGVAIAFLRIRTVKRNQIMLKWTGCRALGLVVALLLPATMSGAQPMPSEQLNHDWLVRWLDRPIDKGARSQRYLDFINASLDETYCGVDCEFP
jgi:hypothetical protein